MLFFPPSSTSPQSVTALEWIKRRDDKRKRKAIKPKGSEYFRLTLDVSSENHVDPRIKALHTRLIEVCEQEQDYDEEFRRPTIQAFDAAWHLIQGAAKRLLGTLPEVWVCADGEGGLSSEWRRGELVVVLLVPPYQSDAARIYYTIDHVGVSKSIAEATPLALAEALSWLRSFK